MEIEAMLCHIKGWLGTGSINVFGPPFAGKDTQCELLAKVLGGHVIAGGDLLRNNPLLTPQEREIMTRGELLPRDDYLRLVRPSLSLDEFANIPLIYASVGRYFGEEGTVMLASKQAGHTVRVAIVLDVSIEVALQRQIERRASLDRGLLREDDDPEVLPTRFKEFMNKTRPVVDYYKNEGKLITLKGVGSIKDMHQRIVEALYDFAIARPRR